MDGAGTAAWGIRMITSIKIAGMAALLSTGLVSGLHGLPAARPGGKTFTDRLPDGPVAPAPLAATEHLASTLVGIPVNLVTAEAR